MPSPDFPLLVLQPALGPRHEWAGVRVLGAEAADAAALARLFGEFGLAAAIPGLACLLPPGVAQGIAAAALPDGFTLRDDDNAPAPPAPVQPPSKGPTKALLLKILGQITCDAETREIEATLKQDPQLSVQLLRLVNSAAFAPTTRINSFAHAITLIGRRQLQRWLQLLLFSRGADVDLAHNPLLQLAALRGRFMELLAERLVPEQRELRDPAFLTGLMSIVPAALGMSMTDVLGQIAVGSDVRLALARREGALGQMLALTERYDDNDIDGVLGLLAAYGTNGRLGVLGETLTEALAWVQQLGMDGN